MPKRERITITLTPELKRALEDYTRKVNAECGENVSVSWMVQDILFDEFTQLGYKLGERIFAHGGKRDGAGRPSGKD